MGENKVGGACSMHGKYEKKEQNISRKTWRTQATLHM
jgi:hypothetical protein